MHPFILYIINTQPKIFTNETVKAQNVWQICLVDLLKTFNLAYKNI